MITKSFERNKYMTAFLVQSILLFIRITYDYRESHDVSTKFKAI